MTAKNELQTLDEQIAELQAKKKNILNSQRASALEEARKNVKLYGFTAQELGLSSSSSSKPKSSASITKEAKYVNPDNSADTWHGGKGPKPKWVHAQLAAGRTLEELLIKR